MIIARYDCASWSISSDDKDDQELLCRLMTELAEKYSEDGADVKYKLDDPHTSTVQIIRQPK